MRTCCSGCDELRQAVGDLARLVYWLADGVDNTAIQGEAQEIARTVEAEMPDPYPRS